MLQGLILQTFFYSHLIKAMISKLTLSLLTTLIFSSIVPPVLASTDLPLLV